MQIERPKNFAKKLEYVRKYLSSSSGPLERNDLSRVPDLLVHPKYEICQIFQFMGFLTQCYVEFMLSAFS